MKDIALFGAGGLSKEVASLIDRINRKQGDKWRIVGFFDDNPNLKGKDVSHFGKVLGGVDDLNKWESPLDVAISIGNPKAIRKVRNRITNPNISFPNVIATTFGMADVQSFSIGEGNIIQGGCWASNDVTIGNFNLLNGDIVLGHDAKIGDYNVLMPDIRVSGEVSIGECNLIGVGSIILQQLKIGNHVTLGAGAVLMTKPKNGCTYLGNPAKLFKF